MFPFLPQAGGSGGTTVMTNTGSMPIMASLAQQPTTVLGQSGTQATVSTTTSGTINTSSLPQMLFLNQVTLNGQTSFVLVDANNKPVQLPQGKVPSWNFQG